MNTLPALSEAKNLAEVHEQSLTISKMAADLMNEPIVQEGYMLSGKVPAMAFINAASMAKKRLRGLFPVADFTEPLYERLMAEAKLIAAECVHLKYECRKRNQPYDHLKDCTIRIQKMVRDMFVQYSEMIKALEADDAKCQPCIGNE